MFQAVMPGRESSIRARPGINVEKQEREATTGSSCARRGRREVQALLAYIIGNAAAVKILPALSAHFRLARYRSAWAALRSL